MANFEKGDRVKYIGCDTDQISWGGNDDPREILFIGEQYYIENVEIHSYHTKLTLANIRGKFNSVCFEKV